MFNGLSYLTNVVDCLIPMYSMDIFSTSLTIEVREIISTILLFKFFPDTISQYVYQLTRHLPHPHMSRKPLV